MEESPLSEWADNLGGFTAENIWYSFINFNYVLFIPHTG